MNIRSKRFMIVLLTLIFTVSVFTVTAFAQGEITSGEGDPALSSISTESTQPDPGATQPDPGTTQPGDGTTPPGDGTIQPGDGTTQPGDGTAKPGDGTAKPGDGTAKPGTQTNGDTTKPKNSSSKAVAPTRTIDTQTNRVEATASQAAQAVSDPDILSSENWSELLSNGDQTQSQSETAGTSAVSSTASPAEVGGVSWILILGIVLIVLALCGFGLFVYLQFFSNNNDGRNGRGGQGSLKSNPKNAPAKEDSEKTQTFIDISSASDGKQHRGDYVPSDTKAFVDVRSSSSAAPVKPAEKPRPVKKAPVNDTDITRQIPKAALPDRKPAVPEQRSEPLSKSQATPVTNDSNFDWEKFFNDQK